MDTILTFLCVSIYLLVFCQHKDSLFWQRTKNAHVTKCNKTFFPSTPQLRFSIIHYKYNTSSPIYTTPVVCFMVQSLAPLALSWTAQPITQNPIILSIFKVWSETPDSFPSYLPSFSSHLLLRIYLLKKKWK